MLTGFLNVLFGCMHRKYSFPQDIRPGRKYSEAIMATGKYVTCLDCGKEFAYDWTRMKVMTDSQALALASSREKESLRESRETAVVVA